MPPVSGSVGPSISRSFGLSVGRPCVGRNAVSSVRQTRTGKQNRKEPCDSAFQGNLRLINIDAILPVYENFKELYEKKSR